MHENSLPIRDDRYQVFLLTCLSTFPLTIGAHPWFVVNKKGDVSRWEVFWRPQREWRPRWGHLHKDFYQPTEGISAFFFSEKYHWGPGTLRGFVEGGEGSLAHEMAACIENTPQTYPYLERYSFTGPNSNTYAQWVLDKFPESGLKLPWNAFGKHFK